MSKAAPIEVKWVKEVPEPKLGGGKRPKIWEPIVERLKTRPNKWAHVRSYRERGTARSVGDAIRTRFPGIETKVRGTDVYARWIGDAGRMPE